MSLTQLVYYSRNRAVAGTDCSHLDLLRTILSASRRNNARDDVTGFLLFDRTWFFQVLEGERPRVIPTYDRIQKDQRHGEVTLMSMRDVRRRSFPRWSMGGAMRSLEQQEIYLRHGVSGALDPARIMAPGVVALAMDLQDFEIAQQGGALRPTG